MTLLEAVGAYIDETLTPDEETILNALIRSIGNRKVIEILDAICGDDDAE